MRLRRVRVGYYHVRKIAGLVVDQSLGWFVAGNPVSAKGGAARTRKLSPELRREISARGGRTASQRRKRKQMLAPAPALAALQAGMRVGTTYPPAKCPHPVLSQVGDFIACNVCRAKLRWVGDPAPEKAVAMQEPWCRHGYPAAQLVEMLGADDMVRLVRRLRKKAAVFCDGSCHGQVVPVEVVLPLLRKG